MKTFDEMYQELKSTESKELGNAWKEANEEKRKNSKISLLICLIVDIFTIKLFLYPSMAQMNSIFGFNILRSICTLIPIIVIDFIIYAVLNFTMGKKQREYGKIYKNTIINKMIANFYTNLEYFPEKEMPEYIYEEPNYNESYNRYSSDDYFEAQINNNNSIQMAEVETVREETRRDSDGKTHTTRTQIFHGLFAKILLDKSINSELKILLNGSMFFNKKRLNMDSSEFEKYFDVQASNPIIGMQILTADVMQELVDFQNKTNIKYDVIINNDTLYLRFHCGSMFEPTNIKNGAINKEELEKYFYMLNFTYNLSNKIIGTVNETEI